MQNIDFNAIFANLTDEQKEAILKACTKLDTKVQKAPPKTTRKKKVVEKEPEAPVQSVDAAPRKILKKSTKKVGKGGKNANSKIPAAKVTMVRTNIPIGPRPNLFETSPEKDGAQADIAIDRKLWKGRKPEARRGEVSYVESTCTECDIVQEVHPSLTYRSDDGWVHTCERCLSGKRK